MVYFNNIVVLLNGKYILNKILTKNELRKSIIIVFTIQYYFVCTLTDYFCMICSSFGWLGFERPAWKSRDNHSFSDTWNERSDWLVIWRHLGRKKSKRNDWFYWRKRYGDHGSRSHGIQLSSICEYTCMNRKNHGYLQYTFVLLKFWDNRWSIIEYSIM